MAEEKHSALDQESGLCQVSSCQTIATRYMQMLLELDYIPWFYSVLAGAGHWVLLAGYLVVPGTFTSLQEKTKDLDEVLTKDSVEESVIKAIRNPPLLGISCSCLALGVTLMLWLSWERRNNYIWLVNKLFIPTFLNAMAGLVSTLINIYTAQGGDWSIIAIMTVIATGLSMVVSMTLTIFYKFCKLESVKREHEMEISARFHKVSPKSSDSV
ncbi:hypothetical protein BO94DRAFT_552807 [Aspergillus sclerotioniger CBS 115572]|uniref:Uncharacterized protein n=1 Tax=Aspergillus sclerotioniger CBS 115572 TaxID=1450535 RepID=A0A317XCE1_9EURO|nr:hypothetical protein BO94DRAFT_552807 [Aspergillus sclerotioniger CBS 115572]PWY96005.1 hypothetical protein BO94DRAFT_552807 [Aspergillus sclerotioniger CBS 115572]